MARKKSPRKRSASSKKKPAITLKRILVPIDFSGHSKSALQYAISFSMQFHAAIELLYVVEPMIYPSDVSFGQVGFPHVEEEMRKRGSDELDALMKNEIGGRVQASKTIRTGRPFYEISRHAKERNIDVIIIATHGHSGMEHLLFGSTAEKVVRSAPCPVLVVRSEGKRFVRP